MRAEINLIDRPAIGSCVEIVTPAQCEGEEALSKRKEFWRSFLLEICQKNESVQMEECRFETKLRQSEFPPSPLHAFFMRRRLAASARRDRRLIAAEIKRPLLRKDEIFILSEGSAFFLVDSDEAERLRQFPLRSVSLGKKGEPGRPHGIYLPSELITGITFQQKDCRGL